MARHQMRGAIASALLLAMLVACNNPTGGTSPPGPNASKKPSAKPSGSGSASPKPTPTGSGAATPTPTPVPATGGSGNPPKPGATGTPAGATPTPAPVGSGTPKPGGSATPTPAATGTPAVTGPVVLRGDVSTIAGPRSTYPDPAPDNARIQVPEGLAVDPAGLCYVADAQNNRIRVVDAAAGTVKTFAGGGPADLITGGGFVNGTFAEARFKLPSDVVRGKDGAFYVADAGNAAIRKIDPVAKTVSTLIADKDTAADAVKLGQPRRLAVDPATGDLYVAGTAAIFKVTTGATPAVTKILTENADGLAFDPRGALILADRATHTIRKLDLKAAATASVVVAGGTAGKKDDTGAAAQFNSPEGVAVTAEGTIYVADTGNNLLRRISPAGVVDTLAGGATGAVKDGLGTRAVLEEPKALALGPTGSLFVAEAVGDVRLVK